MKKPLSDFLFKVVSGTFFLLLCFSVIVFILFLINWFFQFIGAMQWNGYFFIDNTPQIWLIFVVIGFLSLAYIVMDD